MTAQSCRECGARYTNDSDSCDVRFHALLALDHSRQEPWGVRHGQAFAAFALQHPSTFPTSLDAAWSSLFRIYCLDEAPLEVFGSLRRGKGGGHVDDASVPRRRSEPVSLPTMTIVDLADFAAPTYAAQLDAWCRATLAAWGAPSDAPAA
jgi:Family of unknown function (DUF5946)